MTNKEEEKVLSYREYREITDAYVKTSKELWKQKVLAEVDLLIKAEQEHINEQSGFAHLDEVKYRGGIINSAELTIKNLRLFKEKINGL